MPDDAYAPVSGVASRAESRFVMAFQLPYCVHRWDGSTKGLFDGGVDRVELVVAGHLLDELPATQILEHNEVAQEVQEAALLEHALQ